MFNIPEIENFENTKILKQYKVLNVNDKNIFQIRTNINTNLKLKFYKNINGTTGNLYTNINEKMNDIFTEYDYTNSISFFTNEVIEENGFYLYTFDEKPNPETCFYYANGLTRTINDDNEESLTTIELNDIRALKTINNNNFKIEIVDFDDQEILKKMTLCFNTTSFINNISFVSNTGKIITPNNVKVKDNYFLPTIATPIIANENKVVWSFEFWKHIINFNVLDYLENEEKKEFSLNDFFGDNEPLIAETLYKCIFVSLVLQSGFLGYTKEQKENFKAIFYSGNDAAPFCDYLINKIIDIYKRANNQVSLNKIKTIILMLSSYIKSQHTWKGGFNTEHYIGLPFYLLLSTPENINDYEEFKRQAKFVFQSEWYNWEILEDGLTITSKIKLSDINKGLINFNGNILSFKELPNKLNEVNLSNSPVEFNTKESLNLNYLFFNALENERRASFPFYLGYQPKNPSEKPKPKKRIKKTISGITFTNLGFNKKALSMLSNETVRDYYLFNSSPFKQFKAYFWFYKWKYQEQWNDVLADTNNNFLPIMWSFSLQNYYTDLRHKASFAKHKALNDLYEKYNYDWRNYLREFLINNNYITTNDKIDFNTVNFKVEMHSSPKGTDYTPLPEKTRTITYEFQNPSLFWNIFNNFSADSAKDEEGWSHINYLKFNISIKFEVINDEVDSSAVNKNQVSHLIENSQEIEKLFYIDWTSRLDSVFELEFDFQDNNEVLDYIEINSIFDDSVEIRINDKKPVVFNLSNKIANDLPKTIIKI
ncbi:hypothetical protein [[Mycoplasma] anseris]|uniref:Uncharacterized protein n=1 Tax=[Mycoplasma] anseris TaxID=92400 RepID=A0A2Z4NDS8_9BACT|nr:hypothetical protein [[Mycoplasma] anseris]AWX69699.1 hypothetical protein DP065_03010 [[Mycoplasma] anseris]